MNLFVDSGEIIAHDHGIPFSLFRVILCDIRNDQYLGILLGSIGFVLLLLVVFIFVSVYIYMLEYYVLKCIHIDIISERDKGTKRDRINYGTFLILL